MKTPTQPQTPGPYTRTRPSTPIDLWLDSNEGPPLPDELRLLLADAAGEPAAWRRYPDDAPLRELLARRHDVAIEQVVLGAGADELLDRACRAWLPSGRALLAPTPCFAMLPRYVQAAGATMLELPWTTGSLDLDAMDQLARAAALVCVTTPNNPTGLAVPTDALCELISRRPDTPFLVDLAYVDYADEDPTRALLQFPNAVIVRTFSKGRSLAGLRVGYALAAPRAAATLRATGSPYPCSAVSLEVCRRLLEEDVPDRRLRRVRAERVSIAAELRAIGFVVTPSQANFVFATGPSPSAAAAVAARLAARGVAVRTFTEGSPQLRSSLRVTCPGDAAALARLLAALSAEGNR